MVVSGCVSEWVGGWRVCVCVEGVCMWVCMWVTHTAHLRLECFHLPPHVFHLLFLPTTTTHTHTDTDIHARLRGNVRTRSQTAVCLGKNSHNTRAYSPARTRTQHAHILDPACRPWFRRRVYLCALFQHQIFLFLLRLLREKLLRGWLPEQHEQRDDASQHLHTYVYV